MRCVCVHTVLLGGVEMKRLWIYVMLSVVCGFFHVSESHGGVEILNVSYDPTRELYQEYNKRFAEYWQSKAGVEITIRQSHGGAGKQARAVIDGLEADVVTLALSYDIDAIEERTGLLGEGWQSRFPNNNCPYTSTIVFLVRKGNPKNIRDWNDLVKENVEVITPNPKTSGGARWNYLAAWGYAERKFGGDIEQIKAFMAKFYRNVPVLDSGARGSTMTFVQRRIGDVLLAWENEALLGINKLDVKDVEIVLPSVSILAEPPVALLAKNAEKHGVLEVAEEYLERLYTQESQELVAKYYYRPQAPEVLKKYESQFPDIEMFTIDGTFGGWQAAQSRHFADGGLFDSIYETGKR